MIVINIFSAFILLLSCSGENGSISKGNAATFSEISDLFYPKYAWGSTFISDKELETSTSLQKVRTTVGFKKISLLHNSWVPGLGSANTHSFNNYNPDLDIPKGKDSKPVIPNTFFFLVFKLLAVSF